MSQNTYVTASVLGRVRVRAGWDAPLQEIYCSVEPLDVQADFDGQTPRCFLEFAYADIPSMIASLAEGGIMLPADMRQAIESDVRAGAGNVIRDFGADWPSSQLH
ncbi:hypothetical protein [Ramlibacter sp.]|uniref:hypothetical protein n=1 Tax=Ramlibacter sp. TaxID=1917967 RepID=UPI002D71D7F2|nr:hypothetical protein [Ramlibacter sp.]HYD77533.1 hypothetical protein [Ramlibacter sp.]